MKAKDVTLWTLEIDALKRAGDEIQKIISRDWDVDDSNQKDMANDIADMIRRAPYRSVKSCLVVKDRNTFLL